MSVWSASGQAWSELAAAVEDRWRGGPATDVVVYISRRCQGVARSRYTVTRETDHWHRKGTARSHRCKDVSTLLGDFRQQVDTVLGWRSNPLRH